MIAHMKHLGLPMLLEGTPFVRPVGMVCSRFGPKHTQGQTRTNEATDCTWHHHNIMSSTMLPSSTSFVFRTLPCPSQKLITGKIIPDRSLVVL